MASVTKAILWGASPNPSLTMGSCTWNPSLISSMVTLGSSTAAGIGPGSRWCSPFMALNIWVMIPAPGVESFSGSLVVGIAVADRRNHSGQEETADCVDSMRKFRRDGDLSETPIGGVQHSGYEIRSGID